MIPVYPIKDLIPFQETSFIPINITTASKTVYTAYGGATKDFTSLIASLGILDTALLASSRSGFTVANSFSASSFC